MYYVVQYTVHLNKMYLYFKYNSNLNLLKFGVSIKVLLTQVIYYICAHKMSNTILMLSNENSGLVIMCIVTCDVYIFGISTI